MKKQFWYSIAITAGILISSAAVAAQPRVDPQNDAKRPMVFGVPAPRPNTTQAPAPTAPRAPAYRRDRDRRHERDWRRDHHRDHRYRESRYRRDHSPAGWSKGRKTGWGGHDLPPGQAKKAGYHPGRNFREHARDDHRGFGREHRK